MLAASTLGQLLRMHIRKRLAPYILACTVLSLGFVAGGLATKALDVDERTRLTALLEAYFSQPALAEPFSDSAGLVYDAFAADVLRTAVLMWVLGLTVVGAPLILALLYFRGFAIGFTVKLLIDEMLWRGGILAAVALVPHNLLGLVGMVVAAVSGLAFAATAARILLGRGREHAVYGQLAASSLQTLIAGGLIVGALFVEAYITPVLIQVAVKYFL